MPSSLAAAIMIGVVTAVGAGPAWTLPAETPHDEAGDGARRAPRQVGANRA